MNNTNYIIINGTKLPTEPTALFYFQHQHDYSSEFPNMSEAEALDYIDYLGIEPSAIFEVIFDDLTDLDDLNIEYHFE